MSGDNNADKVSSSVGGREPSPHDRKTLKETLLVLVILVLTLAASMYKGQSIYIFGYIIAIVYAVGLVT